MQNVISGMSACNALAIFTLNRSYLLALCAEYTKALLAHGEAEKLDLHTAEFAASMDAKDVLSELRSEFSFPKGPTQESAVYLCGNSLGLQPKGLRKYITQQLDKWDEQGVEGHFTGKPFAPTLTQQ
jgi:hypothetical protein